MASAEFGRTRVPPQNIEAEQSVLGAVLLDNQAAHEVTEILRPEDFYKESHREIFAATLALLDRNEPADLVTLTNELKKEGKLDRLGGAAYMASLVEAVPTAANVMHYARIVKEKAVLRDIISAATEIATGGYEEKDIEEYLDEAETKIFRISERRLSGALLPISSVIKESFRQIEENYERKQLITGLSTGFRDLDKLTAGLQGSDLVIVAGRPSMGKTSFCLNIAQHAAMISKMPVAVFSLEMARHQLAQRLLCSLARIDSSRLRTGIIDEEEWMRLTQAAGELSESPIYIDDTPQVTVLEMRAKARRLKAARGLGLVVVDYIQLMTSRGKYENREREISEISRSLKAMAKELNVPVLALSQLNRGVENRTDKRPQMSDLRESGAIEQDADIVGFIYRDEVYNKESPDRGIAEFIVAKHRNGPIGVTKLAFLAQYTRFENLAFEYPGAAMETAHA
ncbi:MAG TPA: replicative DNA helicase [Bdellovibrionota bacterium]|nr:replicative DNA helicase [Bdellovibrionota bacterium]